MKKFIYTILFLMLPLRASSQEYHPWCYRDSTDYGENMTRTLSLLGKSTANQPYDVNILVYGQSVSKQKWWLFLEENLKAKFPYARIHMVNKSVGGFASQKLWKTTIFDVLPFYPDLVIFHVFGSHIDYEKILQMIRSKTTAEMLVWNDPWAGPDTWADTMSYHLIPAFCERYKLEFANIRTKWIEYLGEHNLQGRELRHDGVHLNDEGNRLLAAMLMPYFNYDPGRTPDPYHLVDTIVPAKPVQPGSLGLHFTGNRVDLYLEPFTNDTVK
ncbi:MAG TPA: SGNH/GDSL hydrolase family protein, partial [Bacteroidales bacterium]|nr:SGNH/GDSL hydrolase family protein [Bacteroidales bacterium]